MTTLYDPAEVDAMKARIANLRPDSVRQWGKMNAPQVVAHLAAGLEMAVGDLRPKRMLLGGIIGRLVKPLALGAGPMKRNSPTSPDLVVSDERDLARERERLNALIDRFVTAGPAGCTTHPHTFFGRMTPDEWATLMHKHLDHHLRQFGV